MNSNAYYSPIKKKKKNWGSKKDFKKKKIKEKMKIKVFIIIIMKRSEVK